MTAIIAIIGGGDWTDASVDFVYNAAGYSDDDIDALQREYEIWLKSNSWSSLPEWLKLYKGFRDTVNGELLVIEEC